MYPRKPKPCELKFLSGSAQGWQSSRALGIVKGSDQFHSFLMLPAVLIASGFATLQHAHLFNYIVLQHKQLYVGSPFLADLYDSVGGEEEARETIAGLKLRVQRLLDKAQKENVK
jgi:hypothetical protein